MTRSNLKILAAACCCVAAASGCAAKKQEKVTPELVARGGKLFAVYCAGCHPGGENRIYPQKSLHALELKANGIASADDIVMLIRNPGRGMKRFDKRALTDADARAIAEYILATF